MKSLPPIDEWILGRLEAVKNTCLKAYDEYSFPVVSGTLGNFMVELSSFYLDFAKDVLYCEEAHNKRRKAIQYVLYELSMTLCLLYNPILSFTMDEVYKAIPSHKKESPQLDDMPSFSHEYQNAELYKEFMKLRDAALKELEEARNRGELSSNMEAKLTISLPSNTLYEVLKKLDEQECSEMFGVSQFELKNSDSLSILIYKAEGERCDRCRRIERDTKHYDDGLLCGRCAKVMGK